MATFTEFYDLNINFSPPEPNFGTHPNIQHYNGYIYGGYGDGNGEGSFLYRLNITNTSFSKSPTPGSTYDGVRGIAVDSTGVYFYSRTHPTVIGKCNLDLTNFTTIPLTLSGSFSITDGDCLVINGDYLYINNTNNIYKISKTGVVSIYHTPSLWGPGPLMCINKNTGFIYYIFSDDRLYAVDTSGNLVSGGPYIINDVSAIGRQIEINNGIIYIPYKTTTNDYLIGEYDISSSTFTSKLITGFPDQNSIAGITFNAIGNMYVRQSGYSIIYLSTTYCFNKGTKIFCLNTELIDEYVPIENLQEGDFVKTFKHGYRKVIKVITGSFRNNPNNWNMCMYKMAKTDSNGLLEDLIVTGGHSLLVDSISEVEQTKYDEMSLTEWSKQTIDGKRLLLACVSDQFVPMPDNETYTYFHLLLENNNDEEERFGIYANGILTETPNEKTLK